MTSLKHQEKLFIKSNKYIESFQRVANKVTSSACMWIKQKIILQPCFFRKVTSQISTQVKYIDYHKLVFTCNVPIEYNSKNNCNINRESSNTKWDKNKWKNLFIYNV